MWFVIAAFAGSIATMAITVWGMWLVFAVVIGSMVDAGLRYRRLRGQIRWSATNALIAFGVAIVLGLGLRAFVVEAFRLPASSMSPTLQIGDHVFINKLVPRWRSPARGEIIVFRQPCSPDRDYIKRVIALENDTVEIRCGVVYVDGAAIPTVLERASDRYEDRDESSDQRFERPVSRYRESLGGRTYQVFQDPDRPERDARRGKVDVGEDAKDFPRELAPSCAQEDGGSEPWGSSQLPGQVVTVGPPSDPCKPYRHYVVPAGHVFVLGDHRSNSNDSRYWGSVPVDNIKGPVIGIWQPWSRFGRVE
jgi:signal peptidase I